MMRLVSWPNLFSLLAVLGGPPILLWLGLTGWTVALAVGTAVAFIIVVSHVIGTFRVGHAI
jgi:hypothetical protein